MSKKKIPKELEENQMVMITKKELDILKLQSSFFINYYKNKTSIINLLAGLSGDDSLATEVYYSLARLNTNNKWQKFCATIGEDEKE